VGIVQVMGVAAGLFALTLVALPTIRVAQGRLPPRSALGLWISGLGFALLAAAALVLEGDAARGAMLGGVVAAVVGNIVQRRTARPPG
jgi:uncharacterized membrane protein YbhN (UPF0104 family)